MLKVNDRVRNKDARSNLGTIIEVSDTWVKVRWDLRPYEFKEAVGKITPARLELIEPNPHTP